MNRYSFRIELKDDCVLSRRSASLGGHESLDFIPGQTLLGACAARLYQQKDIDSYILFHSGRVRFGNALPLTAEGPAWPIPLCWYEKKMDPARAGSGRSDGLKVFNFQHMDGFDDSSQPRQLRDGYVDNFGHFFRPHRELRMKTAIDPQQGRAARAQLFGYQSLSMGSRFCGWIEADEDVPEDMFKRVIRSLEGPLLLGRSRSAEYGRVELTPAEFELPPSRLNGKRLVLWLLSDLALIDANGQPTLEPTPDRLGLPAGQIDWDQSALRSRVYTPWNGKRGAPDLERSVIQQGSVITYQLDLEPDIEQGENLMKYLQSGLGLYREAGLGRVWVNPSILEKVNPDFSKLEGHGFQAPNGIARDGSDHPLINWLKSRTGADIEHERIGLMAGKLSKDYLSRLEMAYRERPFGPRETYGPSKAQWGRVLEKARTTDAAGLFDALFSPDNGVIKENSVGWSEVFWSDNRYSSLGNWLRAELETIRRNSNDDLARLVQRLAHICREQSAGEGHVD